MKSSSLKMTGNLKVVSDLNNSRSLIISSTLSLICSLLSVGGQVISSLIDSDGASIISSK